MKSATTEGRFVAFTVCTCKLLPATGHQRHAAESDSGDKIPDEDHVRKKYRTASCTGYNFAVSPSLSDS
jgi:hypothetical protein